MKDLIEILKLQILELKDKGIKFPDYYDSQIKRREELIIEIKNLIAV